MNQEITPKIAKISIALMCILYVPIHVTAIVLGALVPGSCDNTDPESNLKVGDYLIGYGVSGITITIIFIIAYGIVICRDSTSKIATVVFFSIIIDSVFNVAWFIIGAVILFRSNLQCIENQSTHVIFALVLWCLSACGVISNLCKLCRGRK